MFMIFAGIAHLTYQRIAFQALVPKWLPQDPLFTDFIVLASGVLEIALGLALLFIQKYRPQLGLALSIFFVLVFLGNIDQYTNGIDAFRLDTDLKRLIRLFFQPLLILWALWSTGAIQFYFPKKEK